MSENKYPIGGYAPGEAGIKCPECGGLNGAHANYKCPAMTLEYAQNKIVEIEQRWIKVSSRISAGNQSLLIRLKKLISFYQGKVAVLKAENNKLRRRSQPKSAGAAPRDGAQMPAVDHDQAHINMDAGMPDFEAYYQAGFGNGHDVGYEKAKREDKSAGLVWPLFIVDKATGERHEVNKIVYHPENEPEPHIWCDTWYGHHVIGKDCKWATNESDTSNNDHITAALQKFISMHETGLLPNRFTYEEGKKALEGM